MTRWRRQVADHERVADALGGTLKVEVQVGDETYLIA